MSEAPANARISDIGEKSLIRDFIKPFFNSADDPAGVGDDCAMVAFGDEVVLLSTDRVPSDLTAFKLGILDFHGLGDYLGRLIHSVISLLRMSDAGSGGARNPHILPVCSGSCAPTSPACVTLATTYDAMYNFSDIAACGGQAVGLLLNLGLPNDTVYEDARALCRGFGKCAERHGATVLGGDITSASELSISATAIGRVAREHILTRRGARPGDSIFVSRPLGLTPTAFRVFLGKLEAQFSGESLALLRRQFTEMEPLFTLGQSLGTSGQCGACMDNTDGVGQSLTELSEASKCSFVVHADALRIPPIAEKVSRISGLEALSFVFNGGADFSLVGTLRGAWTNESASLRFGHPLEIIGHVEAGSGVWLESEIRVPLNFRGWNYFAARQRTSRGGQN